MVPVPVIAPFILIHVIDTQTWNLSVSSIYMYVCVQPLFKPPSARSNLAESSGPSHLAFCVQHWKTGRAWENKAAGYHIVENLEGFNFTERQSSPFHGFNFSTYTLMLVMHCTVELYFAGLIFIISQSFTKTGPLEISCYTASSIQGFLFSLLTLGKSWQCQSFWQSHHWAWLRETWSFVWVAPGLMGVVPEWGALEDPPPSSRDCRLSPGRPSDQSAYATDGNRILITTNQQCKKNQN